ncbi:MAG TPA: DUF1579 family protein [Fimbriimonadaceae bacterium]|nr:DUF1579 family protein [Fimbriimonadaceae bacterium]HRJ97441.1 DUF1579 family protein [Fimbriimonadaceae bacterium]
MRYLFSLSLLVAVALVGAQDFKPSKPPEEIKQVSFMLGNWQGKEMFTFGGMKSEGTGGHHVQIALAGRFVESHYRGKNASMGDMEGRLLMCYDPEAKKFKSWWFDAAAPGALEMEGNVKGESLVMESKPMEMPGEGLQTYRAVFAKKGEQLTFVLSMKQGSEWVPMIEATYSKK